MANVLIVGLLVALRRRGTRPFLLGFEAFGLVAWVAYIALVAFHGHTLVRPYLFRLQVPVFDAIGRSRAHIPIFVFAAAVILGWWQLALALVGGLISRSILGECLDLSRRREVGPSGDDRRRRCRWQRSSRVGTDTLAGRGPVMRLPRVRFSVRLLMALVLILAVGLGWLVRRARVQRRAVDAVGRAGGVVEYDWQFRDGQNIPRGRPPGPPWLAGRLGVDYLGSVSSVLVSGRGSDEELRRIGDLPRVERLIFTVSRPTADGLAYLDGLTGLRYLDLSKSGVTDAGVAHVRNLDGLEWLILKDCPVGDAALADLRGLRRLEGLGLNQTRVSDAGLAHLRGLTGLRFLYLTGTGIGDDGLAHLEGLSGLRVLYLNDTKVTDAGLEHLRALTGLGYVNLAGTRVTDCGVERLRGALPKLKVAR